MDNFNFNDRIHEHKALSVWHILSPPLPGMICSLVLWNGYTAIFAYCISIFLERFYAFIEHRVGENRKQYTKSTNSSFSHCSCISGIYNVFKNLFVSCLYFNLVCMNNKD